MNLRFFLTDTHSFFKGNVCLLFFIEQVSFGPFDGMSDQYMQAASEKAAPRFMVCLLSAPVLNAPWDQALSGRIYTNCSFFTPKRRQEPLAAAFFLHFSPNGQFPGLHEPAIKATLLHELLVGAVLDDLSTIDPRMFSSQHPS